MPTGLRLPFPDALTVFMTPRLLIRHGLTERRQYVSGLSQALGAVKPTEAAEMAKKKRRKYWRYLLTGGVRRVTLFGSTDVRECSEAASQH